MLHRGARLFISDTLIFSILQRNLLSFKDIYQNGYHINIIDKGGI
jgi:hypothetical protein